MLELNISHIHLFCVHLENHPCREFIHMKLNYPVGILNPWWYQLFIYHFACNELFWCNDLGVLSN